MLEIDGNHLKLEDVVEVARFGKYASLNANAREAVEQSRSWVDAIASGKQPVYGINTGYGVFSDRRIHENDLRKQNRNLILSHATGSGEALPGEVVRAAMLIRANTLAKGYSGVRPEIIETLLNMLERGVTPVIPSQGSLGSSGDLGPLSFLGLVFTTGPGDRDEESGLAAYEGKVISGKAAMEAAGIPRIELGPKEGLALNNGATFSAAIAALAIYDAANLVDVASISLAMSLEALLGCSAAFDSRIQGVRGHPGQIEIAKAVRELILGSTLVNSAGRVQDAYSLRCGPQIQGAVADTLRFVRETIEREINAATDNPLLFDPDSALSGGNFHGEPVGLAMDYLAIAVAELAAIAERRIYRLTDGKLNAGLPPMLVDRAEDAGIDSGLMMPQYTAAALVLENRTLATPDSVNSLPTSAEQEDQNANSMTAARHARQVCENTASVLAIEVYTAARALDLRLRQSPDSRPGAGTAKAYRAVRDVVPYHAEDTWWNPEIQRVRDLVTSGKLAAMVHSSKNSG